SHRIVPSDFRGGGKDRPDRDVIDRFADGGGQLLGGMRREANRRVWADNRTDARGGQVVLPHVNSSGAADPRDVGSIIHDDKCTCWFSPAHDRRTRVEQPTARAFFGSNLKKACAAVKAGRGEIDKTPAGALRRVRVADRAEARRQAS